MQNENRNDKIYPLFYRRKIYNAHASCHVDEFTIVISMYRTGNAEHKKKSQNLNNRDRLNLKNFFLNTSSSVSLKRVLS